MGTKYRRVAGPVRITKDGGIDRNLPGSAAVNPEHKPSVEKLLKMFFLRSKSFMPGDEYYATARPFMPQGSNSLRYAIRLGSYWIVCTDVRKNDSKFDWYLDWYRKTGRPHRSVSKSQGQWGIQSDYGFLERFSDLKLLILERARHEGLRLLQAVKGYDWRSILSHGKHLNRK